MQTPACGGQSGVICALGPMLPADNTSSTGRAPVDRGSLLQAAHRMPESAERQSGDLQVPASLLAGLRGHRSARCAAGDGGRRGDGQHRTSGSQSTVRAAQRNSVRCEEGRGALELACSGLRAAPRQHAEGPARADGGMCLGCQPFVGVLCRCSGAASCHGATEPRRLRSSRAVGPPAK